ncbi:hypothetical protein SLS57_003763 [Botryosphaeria dothidea]
MAILTPNEIRELSSRIHHDVKLLQTALVNAMKYEGRRGSNYINYKVFRECLHDTRLDINGFLEDTAPKDDALTSSENTTDPSVGDSSFAGAILCPSRSPSPLVNPTSSEGPPTSPVDDFFREPTSLSDDTKSSRSHLRIHPVVTGERYKTIMSNSFNAPLHRYPISPPVHHQKPDYIPFGNPFGTQDLHTDLEYHKAFDLPDTCTYNNDSIPADAPPFSPLDVPSSPHYGDSRQSPERSTDIHWEYARPEIRQYEEDSRREMRYHDSLRSRGFEKVLPGLDFISNSGSRSQAHLLSQKNKHLSRKRMSCSFSPERTHKRSRRF